MKVSFVLEHFPPTANASAAILARICTYLVDHGDAVIVVQIDPWGSARREVDHDGVRVVTVPLDSAGTSRVDGKNSALDRLVGRGLNKIRRGFRAAQEKVTGVPARSRMVSRTRSIQRRIIRDMPTDVVVSVCSPFVCHEIGAAVAKELDVPWVLYNIDEYFNNPTEASGRRALRHRLSRERAMLQRARRALVTPTVYDGYRRSPLAQQLSKVSVLELPLLRDLTTDNVTVTPLAEGRVHCSFVGFLYPQLRNPRYVLDVMKHTQLDVDLNFVGTDRDEFPADCLELLEDSRSPRIECFPSVPHEIAIATMQQSNVLIHIGNAGGLMFPSKFLDYCSTGRPIVNFYWTDSCPTLPLARRHPLCLNVKVGEDVQSTAVKVASFVNANHTRRASFEDVVESSPYPSADHVLERFRTNLVEGLVDHAK